MLVRMGVKSMAGIHTDFPVRTRSADDGVHESGGRALALGARDMDHIKLVQV